LVERVRDELDDYGDVGDSPLTLLNGALADTTGQSVVVDDETVADVGDWLYVDFECLEITSVDAGTHTFTVRRGARGSTAATHLDNTAVRVNLQYPPHRVVRALNSALSHAFPELHKMMWDTTLVVVTGQQFYELPSGIDMIRSFWMETDVGSGSYEICRLLELESFGNVALYDGGFESGLHIGVRGVSRFSALASTPESTLDSDFPDNEEAIGYLTMYAAGDLLMRKSAADATKGADLSQWDASGSGDRYVGMNHGKQLRREADVLLQSIKMPLPALVTARPDRRYYGVPS